MRKSLVVGLATGLLAPFPASAAPTATTVRLPVLPAVTRDFHALATSGTVVAWATVGPASRTRVRVWRLAGKRWRLIGDVRRPPALLSPNVVDACPLRSTNGGRTFRPYRTPWPSCDTPPQPPAKVITVAGTSYRAPLDLNAMLVKPPGSPGWVATAPAFAWDPAASFGEAVPDFAVFGAPLRLVLVRWRYGSRGTHSATAFRSTDGGATWQPGPMPGDILASDTLGGGRLYTAPSVSDLAPLAITLSRSGDLGQTWQTLPLEPPRSSVGGVTVEHGPDPGLLAVHGGRAIWVTTDGGVTATAVARVPNRSQVVSTAGRFGDWLLIRRRTMYRVRLTG
jgi:hypothetical protein